MKTLTFLTMVFLCCTFVKTKQAPNSITKESNKGENKKSLAERVEDLERKSLGQDQYIAQLESELQKLQTPSGQTNTPYTRASSVCTGNEITLSCNEGQTLLIQNAEYAENSANCETECCTPHPLDCTESMPSSNTDEWVLLKLRCDNRTACTYLFQGSTFVEQCTVPNTVDYLTIYSICQPESTDLVGFTAYATMQREYDEGDIVLFDGLITNIGSFYDPTSSIFICPTHGIYMFALNILSAYSLSVEVGLRLDSSRISATFTGEVSGTHQTGSVFAIVECQTTSKVWVVAQRNGSELHGNDQQFSTFSGYLLHKLT